MLITAGRVRALTVFAIAVAVVNVSISLALTPDHGLNGVVLGTAISFVVAFPFFIWIVLKTFPVRLADLVREVWVPAYATGVPVTLGLLVARLSLPLDTVVGVLTAAVVALLAYWGIYYAVWLRAGERALVKAVGLGLLRRG